jgi:hypothetical protein
MASRRQRRAKAHAKKVQSFIDMHNRDERLKRETIVAANKATPVTAHDRAWMRVTNSVESIQTCYPAKAAKREGLFNPRHSEGARPRLSLKD